MTVQEPVSPKNNDDPSPAKRQPLFGDDIAYMIPMGVFLLFTWAGGQWSGFFAASYIIKTILTTLCLIWLWPQYTKIKWTHSTLGVLVGIVGVVQWVAMEKSLIHFFPHYPRAHLDSFDPYTTFSSPIVLWTFMFFRFFGPVLLVPFMEELFWRDFLWRTVIAPNDLKLAKIGEWDWRAFVVVTVVFASVHMQMWITALVWGALVGWLLVRTKSLGSCIIAHAVTNLLLGVYVLWTHDWAFW